MPEDEAEIGFLDDPYMLLPLDVAFEDFVAKAYLVPRDFEEIEGDSGNRVMQAINWEPNEEEEPDYYTIFQGALDASLLHALRTDAQAYAPSIFIDLGILLPRIGVSVRFGVRNGNLHGNGCRLFSALNTSIILTPLSPGYS